MARASRALCRGEVGVAGTRAPARRASAPCACPRPRRGEEVFGHAGDDPELLVVLAGPNTATEGAGQREELGDHRGHALEVAGPVRAAEGLGGGAHPHPRLVAGGVHGLGRGREDRGGAGLRAPIHVGLERARVAAKSSRGPNWVGLTKTETTTKEACRSASLTSATCPRWSAPWWGPGRRGGRARGPRRRLAGRPRARGGAASAWKLPQPKPALLVDLERHARRLARTHGHRLRL